MKLSLELPEVPPGGMQPGNWCTLLFPCQSCKDLSGCVATVVTLCVPAPVPASKKPRQRGFLNTLLCCFGSNNQGASNPVITEENGQYSPKLQGKFLLPPVRHQDLHKICLIIDLDETLVHSSFKPISNADFVVPVEIDGTVHQVYVLKRPYVDEFLQRVGDAYECVLFTASLAKLAAARGDPPREQTAKFGIFKLGLLRARSTQPRYLDLDLGRLGRDLHRVVIIDNSPASYIFHPDNAVPVGSWFDDMSDTELRDLIPFFEKLSKVDDVYSVLRNSNNAAATAATGGGGGLVSPAFPTAPGTQMNGLLQNS
ncbi:unnamed protein product [Ixodes persulcatus]